MTPAAMSAGALLRGQVRDAMTPGVFTCLGDVPVREAARILRDRRVHALVGVPLDRQGRPT